MRKVLVFIGLSTIFVLSIAFGVAGTKPSRVLSDYINYREVVVVREDSEGLVELDKVVLTRLQRERLKFISKGLNESDNDDEADDNDELEVSLEEMIVEISEKSTTSSIERSIIEGGTFIYTIEGTKVKCSNLGVNIEEMFEDIEKDWADKGVSVEKECVNGELMGLKFGIEL